MSDLVQLNLSVDKGLRDEVDALAEEHGMSKRQVVTTAIEAFGSLMEGHKATAAKATEPDVADLVLTLARLMPAGLVEGRRTEWGRLSDGRPALIVPMEIDGATHSWFFAVDTNAAGIMAVRRDGGQVGVVSHGRLRPMAETIALEEVVALS